MSAIGAILIGIAAKVGAPLVKSILENKIGGIGGELAGAVVDAIADKAGVTPDELPDLPQDKLEKAVAEVETMTPELIQLWQAGLAGQFALLQAEQKEAWYQSAWRWGWMYLLAAFWIWRIMILPIVNKASSVPIEAVDMAVLLTLTTWFISLYMGGHTVKALGESAINAVKSWKDRSA